MPSSRLAIFLLSTYGEGDPSDNAAQFWDWLKTSSTQPSSLASLRYAVFGLGNSSYRHYNEVAKRVAAALEKGGADRFFDTGYADDAKGTTEEDFARWKDGLFACLQQKLNLTRRDVGYESAITVTFDESMDLIDLYRGEPVPAHAASGKGPFETPTRPVQIKHCEQLFQSGPRNCLHMDLDLTPYPELVYKTGDHLAVSLINPEQEVNGLLRALGREAMAQTPLTIQSRDPATKIALPTPTTLRALFQYYLEICSAVPRETVRALIEFAPTPDAKQYLAELSRDQDTFARFQRHTYLTFSRLLLLATGGDSQATWTALPLEFLLENIPRCRARYYSIASSSILSPRTASITALVSNTPLEGPAGGSIPGVTTNYLLALAQSVGQAPLPGSLRADLDFDVSGPAGCLEGAKVFAHIRRSTFKLPALAKTPLLMAAAGTGIAPFRAFIAERARLQSLGREVGDMILFFGCRHPDEDYLYRRELEEMQRSLGGKLRVVPAFSRAEGAGIPKAYVQDKIRAHRDDVLGLIEADATFYVCGKTSMAKDIGELVSEMVEPGGGGEWVRKMKKMNKWQEDVWG
ncbi:hypothetical protein VTK73DRAFT_3855 [Phialemonium thermophilum]|uniref:NADPH--cytochrome P450 reductase n=1 Tax=Phialemonium thermophilum TaxID=223376 RepID=A0ABR3VG45_9PEZI